jgi:hypothetical protein
MLNLNTTAVLSVGLIGWLQSITRVLFNSIFMSHVLFLQDVFWVGSEINADKYLFVMYVIKFLVNQNITLNYNEYEERTMEKVGYVVS